MTKFWDRLQAIDRRWIFLLLAIAVIVPLLRPIGLNITPTPGAETFYQMVDELPPGSVVMISFDFGPSAAPEVLPVAQSYIRQAFRKKLKVISLALWPDGAPLSQKVTDDVAAEFNAKYGEDYVTLGYKSGVQSVISQMGEGISKAYPKDIRNNPIDSLPLMKTVSTLADVKLTCVLAAGTSIDWWIAVANGRYHTSLVTSTTAVMASDYYSYLQTGQIHGLLGGLEPAAEYQKLVAGKNTAEMSRMMDSQSLVHIVIILFIVLGNLGYAFGSKGKKANAKGQGG